MIGYFKNVIIFTEDKIPSEDIIDKCFPIHIYVKILGKTIKHAFVYGGACLNSFSIDFLKKFGDHLISKFVRMKYKSISYDSDSKACVDHIMLPIQLGTKIMEVMKYILYKNPPYDILLGRPWIHPMRCVQSTLHRLMKFNHDGQEFIVEAMEENPNMIAKVRNTIIPYKNIEIHEYNDEDSEEEE